LEIADVELPEDVSDSAGCPVRCRKTSSRVGKDDLDPVAAYRALEAGVSVVGDVAPLVDAAVSRDTTLPRTSPTRRSGLFGTATWVRT